MVRMMDAVLERYGISATLHNSAGQQQVKVFFHSVNSTSWQNMEQMFVPLGEVPRGQYICVLPAHVRVSAQDTLQTADKAYLIRKVEQMALHTGPVYQWALCVEKGCESGW